MGLTTTGGKGIPPASLRLPRWPGGVRRSPPHALARRGRGHAQPEDPDGPPAGTILTAPLLHLLSYFR